MAQRMGPTGSNRSKEDAHGSSSKGRGFILDADGKARAEEMTNQNSDLFAGGSAVSLLPRNANRVASDFLTHDAIEEEGAKLEKNSLEKKRARQEKILDRLRKKDKKRARKVRREKIRVKKQAYEAEGDVCDINNVEDGGANLDALNGDHGSETLLKNLEATAAIALPNNADIEKRKRQRRSKQSEEMEPGSKLRQALSDPDGSEEEEMIRKRKRFDQIMEKGKVKTDKAFNNKQLAVMPTGDEKANTEEDDAFLNAALAKARRLKRLKELTHGNAASKNVITDATKREEAVARAVEKSRQDAAPTDSFRERGGITFEFDEMQEFTQALRVRENQSRRGDGDCGRRRARTTAPSGKKADACKTDTVYVGSSEAVALPAEDDDMQELAHQIDDDHGGGGATDCHDGYDDAFGSTAANAPVGRGMASFLSNIINTGEIRKHATKEEMRGRAKDKRTYEDYEMLDLKKVVAINEGGAATASLRQRSGAAHEKDLEFARREIKLEYRDDHGRLLTRKEAYRNMCYQFHGHGSSKKNQERRLKQIEREREEAVVASRQQGGTLGALKAAQKATGKAFIIQKT